MIIFDILFYNKSIEFKNKNYTSQHLIIKKSQNNHFYNLI
jgi:hypothetical protein